MPGAVVRDPGARLARRRPGPARTLEAIAALEQDLAIGHVVHRVAS